MTLSPGTALGPYVVVGPLGSGGMGEVYRAQDSRLGREVAVKVLPASFADDPERLARFETEARATGQLNDPNVLSVYDIGTHDGAPYIVAELLEGQTLRDRLIDGALPVRKALEIGAQIARGLAAAHAKGIIHRDLKPENVFITREGRAKVLDFGLARVTTDPKADASAATTLQATNPGTVLGTIGYMSPEQVRGQAADARSDVFALGVILYEMMTGAGAFGRGSAADTLAAILKEDPPDPSAAGVTLPPPVEAVIRRCLEKQPDERFHSARDVAFALEALGGATTSSAIGRVSIPDDPTSRRRARAATLASVAAATLALAAGVAVGWLLFSRAEAPAAPAVSLQQVTFTVGALSQPALAPDSGAVAFVQADAQGNDDIYLLRIGGENPVNLTQGTPADDYHPAFSPDGRLIAFRSEREGGGIFLMGATGESVRRLTDEGFNPAWSPDGRAIVYAAEGVFAPGSRGSVSRLTRIDVATGSRTVIYDGDAVQPAWSPDGQWLAFWGLPAGTGRRVIYTMASTGGTPIALVDDTSLNWSPKWSADGRYIYFASDREPPMNIWRLPVDPATGAAAGPAARVTVSTEEHFALSGGAAGAFIISSRASMSEIRKYPFDPVTGRVGADSTLVMRSSRQVSSIAASPDGEYLAMMVSDPREDLMVMRADGSSVTRLTNDAFRDRGPTWTADSDRLFFYSDRSGQYEGWSIRRDGSGLEQVTKQPAGGLLAGLFPAPGQEVIGLVAVNPTHLALVDMTTPIDARTIEDVPLPDGATQFQPVAWLSADELVGSVPPPVPGGEARVMIYTRSSRSYREIGTAPVTGFGPAGKGTLLGVTPEGRILLFDLATGRTRQGDSLTERLSPDAEVALPAPDGRSLYVIEQPTVTRLWMLTVDGR